MENIFKNAKFGDKFISSDGLKLSYVQYGQGPNYEVHHWLAKEGSSCLWAYNDDGTHITDGTHIVSKISTEENKLIELRDKLCEKGEAVLRDMAWCNTHNFTMEREALKYKYTVIDAIKTDILSAIIKSKIEE